MKIDASIRELILEHHAYNEDTDVKIIKTVYGPHGSKVYLVRLIDSQGRKRSLLDGFRYDSHNRPYVYEIGDEAREDEAELVSWYEAEMEDDE